MSHSCVKNYLHLIFSTKNRLDLIAPEIEYSLYGYLGGIARAKKSSIVIVNGIPNHIHILLKLHPSVALAALVKELKAYSTGWMKKQGYQDFSWQNGYGGFSVSRSSLEAVVAYITKQKEHPQAQIFEAEITSLIKQWQLEWNPMKNTTIDIRK